MSVGLGAQNYNKALEDQYTSYYNASENSTYEYLTMNESLNGPVKKYQEEKLVMDGWFVDNKPHSKWHQYDLNGEKLAEISYTMGKRNGTWKIWDEQGNLRYKYQYRNGKPIGKWEMYNEVGEVVQTKRY
ncbi:MAG: toxin-antitoxin system YwqK family antitoxin [Luteibaculum sp.]